MWPPPMSNPALSKARISGGQNCLSVSNISPGYGTKESTSHPAVTLISMLAHGESTKNMDPVEYLGNLVLLDRWR